MGKQSFLKKFVFNKNTVTVIGVAIIIGVLYFGYNYRINQKVKFVKVPYATQNIDPRTEIIDEMIGETEIPGSMLDGNILTTKEEILNKYSNYNTMIPSGSLFYQSAVVAKEDLPDANWVNVPDCNTVVSLSVNSELTMGNSIYPGNYIDIYYKSTDEEGKTIYVDFIKNIKVLGVKDASGNNVFDKSADLEETAYLLFAVDEYTHLLLTRAQDLGGTFNIVQIAGSFDSPNMADIEIDEWLETEINNRSVILQGQPNSIEEAKQKCEDSKLKKNR